MRAGILHRDLSPNNIMYRIVKEENAAGVVEEKVYGVLADFDLSSLTEDMKDNYTKTSQQRTGTPPFMAHELLDGLEGLHLYRHDLESLFYVMLIVATHYEIQPRTEKEEGGLRMRQGLEELPYEMWFGEPTYKALANHKHSFFSKLEDFDLSPAFEDFHDWLWDFRMSFRHGLRDKEIHKDSIAFLRRKGGASEQGAAPEFDCETLGGHVNYSAFIDPVRKLKGGLEGLIIRYDPSLPTSTAQVDSDTQ